MGIDVVALQLHRGAVANGALDHRRHLGGGAAEELGVHDHRLLLDVPVDEHAPAAVAGVPLGEQVLVVGAEMGGVGRHRGGALAPDAPLAGGEGGVGQLDGGGPGAVEGEVPAGDVADVALAVAVVALGHGADAGVGPVGVGDEQQALPQGVTLDRLPGADRGELGQHPGAQRRLLEHVDQGHRSPAGLDRLLEPAQVGRLGLRLQRAQLDGPALAGADLQPVQARKRLVEGGQLARSFSLGRRRRRRRRGACAASRSARPDWPRSRRAGPRRGCAIRGPQRPRSPCSEVDPVGPGARTPRRRCARSDGGPGSRSPPGGPPNPAGTTPSRTTVSSGG